MGGDQLDDDDTDDMCEQPCEYPGCEKCEGYWWRMVHEGYWVPGKGWTAAAVRQWRK